MGESEVAPHPYADGTLSCPLCKTELGRLTLRAQRASMHVVCANCESRSNVVATADGNIRLVEQQILRHPKYVVGRDLPERVRKIRAVRIHAEKRALDYVHLVEACEAELIPLLPLLKEQQVAEFREERDRKEAAEIVERAAKKPSALDALLRATLARVDVNRINLRDESLMGIVEAMQKQSMGK